MVSCMGEFKKADKMQAFAAGYLRYATYVWYSQWLGPVFGIGENVGRTKEWTRRKQHPMPTAVHEDGGW